MKLFLFPLVYILIHFLTRKLVGNGYHSRNSCEFILNVKLKRNYRKCALLCFFLKKIVGHMSIFGATGTSASDFWWCLLWVSKPEWAALFVLDRGVHEIHLLFISSMRTLKKLLHCVQWLIIRRSTGVDPWGVRGRGPGDCMFPEIHFWCNTFYWCIWPA